MVSGIEHARVVNVASIPLTLNKFVRPIQQALGELGVDSLMAAGAGDDSTDSEWLDIRLSLFRGASIARGWPSAKMSTRRIEALDPTAIHVHTPATAIGLYPTLLALKKRGVKMIYTARGSFDESESSLLRAAWRALDPIRWGIWDAIGVVNQHLLRSATSNRNSPLVRLLSLGGAVPNVPVQGVHLPDPPDWRARGHIRLAWVGRFDKDKRPQDFVGLIHMLREYFGLPVEGVMVGSTLSGDRSVTLTNSKYITALGWQRDPWRTLATCDLLISTSVREGYGLSPCEAGSVGTPTIAYANHGMVESIEAVGGSLVQAKDLWSMANRVAEWSAMSGPEIAEERISIRDEVRLLLENTNQGREVLELYRGAGVL